MASCCKILTCGAQCVNRPLLVSSTFLTNASGMPLSCAGSLKIKGKGGSMMRSDSITLSITSGRRVGQTQLPRLIQAAEWEPYSFCALSRKDSIRDSVAASLPTRSCSAPDHTISLSCGLKLCSDVLPEHDPKSFGDAFGEADAHDQMEATRLTRRQ